MESLLIAGSVGRLEELVIRCLAVGGAFLVGSFGMGFFLKLVVRFYLKRLIPAWMVTGSRVGTGLIFAILAALILFGDGGFGLGGSGGGRPGGPESTERSAKPLEAQPKEEVKAEPVVAPVAKDDAKAERQITVVILALVQPDHRVYLFGDRKEAINLDSLQKDEELSRLIHDPVRPLRVIKILRNGDTADALSREEKDLREWAKSCGLDVQE